MQRNMSIKHILHSISCRIQRLQSVIARLAFGSTGQEESFAELGIVEIAMLVGHAVEAGYWL